MLKNCLPVSNVVNLQDDAEDDLFLWKVGGIELHFAREVWNYFTSRAHVSPPHLFGDGVRWLKNPCHDKNVTMILRIAHQASVYTLWKERNSRLHNTTSRPAAGIILEIKALIRCHLDPLSRAQRLGHQGTSFLATWFGLFNA
ncbi:hypothetical protein AXX17_AT3G27760 [Arabidopsis thaliana]|uniref:Uncharacterized protein n=1 Tax=Arabidopsis thaliana TaxID=3702 RepID=A0A178VFD3_ARATH|nr:hypothetical protein AXX17_AT3G27760 [Arabidopsis thaliana]